MVLVPYLTTTTLPVVKVLQLGAQRTSASAVEVVWTNPDGTRVVGTGTDFAFDDLGGIVGGTLTRIDRFDATGSALHVRFDVTGPVLWLFEPA